MTDELSPLCCTFYEAASKENQTQVYNVLLHSVQTHVQRTGSPFNYLEFPTDIVLLVVFWRLRYKLSLRDVAEMFLERGFTFTREAVRDWETRFAPLMADQLRTQRHGQAGKSWYVDETYIKVHGKWCYLYRAIDQDGNLVDSRLSEKRDMEAVQQFFKQAMAVVGHAPEQVTTDGHRSYPRAIRETMGNGVAHRTNVYLNNCIEQDHRGIKQRYYPMRGFGTFVSATRFCRAFDEVHNYFRSSSLRPYPKTYDTIRLKRNEVNKKYGTNTTLGSQR